MKVDVNFTAYPPLVNTPGKKFFASARRRGETDGPWQAQGFLTCWQRGLEAGPSKMRLARGAQRP
jgi:hypothetical protein